MVTITLTVTAILAIVFGILILVKPRTLNFVVAAWLLLYGILQLLSDLII